MPKKATQEDIARLLAYREENGLTFDELARYAGVCTGTLYRWAKLHRADTDHEDGFAQVVVSDSNSNPDSGPNILIHLQDLAIEVRPGFDPQTLHRLLAILR